MNGAMSGTTRTPGNFSQKDLAIRERNLDVMRVISYVDLCSIIVNGIIILVMLLIVYRDFYMRKKRKVTLPMEQIPKIENNLRPFVGNHFHSFRSILLLILAFLRSLNVGETLIRWTISSVDLSTLLIIAPVISFITTLSTIAFYNYIESGQRTDYTSLLTIPIVMWTLQTVLVGANLYKVLKLLRVGAVSVSSSLNISSIVALLVLVIHDVIICVLEIYVNYKRKKEAKFEKKDENCPSLKFLSKSCLRSSENSPEGYSYFGENFPKLTRPLQHNIVSFVPSPSGTLEREPVEAAEGLPVSSRLKYSHNESNFISRCSFSWYATVLRQGWKRPLEYTDLDKIPESESSKFQYLKFNESFNSANKTNSHTSPSLWHVYMSCYWRTLLLSGILKFLGDTVNIVGPLAITPVVNYVRDVQEGALSSDGEFRDGEYFVQWNEFIRNGWIIAWIALVASLLQSSFSQASSHILALEGIHVRSSLQALIYSKSLRKADYNCYKSEEAPKEAAFSHEQNSGTARIINLATEDAENILSFFLHCHYIWAIPLKVSALVTILWLQLGIAAIYSSVIAILILIPVQFVLAKCISSVNRNCADASDERLLKTHEFLAFIRTIKANVWQNIFLKNVFGAREVELDLLLKDSLLRACMTFITQASGIVIILLAFGFYTITQENPLDEGTAFSSLALFGQLTVPLFILPLIVAYTIKAKRSTNRLEKYLSEPEVSSSRKVSQTSNIEATPLKINTISKEQDQDKKQELKALNGSHFAQEEGMDLDISEMARIRRGYFGLRRDTNNFVVLEDINISIPKGKLTVVVGEVGSGKTSLLLALLQEIPKISGEFYWNGAPPVALVSQTPWLLNCSLKENILFFKGFNRQRYEKVLKAVALTPDVQILPDRDETEIGEKGINLSGGQRQRVAIARALYSDVPVVIMDCPFSSLDTTVSHHVFQEGILEFLLKENSATIIMATQHQQLCQYADKIVYLKDKTIHCQGSPKEIHDQFPHLWRQWKSPTASSPLSPNPPVSSIWKERNSLKRHVSRLNLQYSASRKSLHGSMLEEDMNEIFLRTLPLRRKQSLTRSSPFHTVLPADEMECLHTRTITRKKKLRPSRPPVFRTASSTPAFGRSDEEFPLRGTSPVDRHTGKSLSARLKRHNSLPCDAKRTNVRVERESSVFKKFFRRKSFRNAKSQRKLNRKSTRSRWSIKRFISTDEDTVDGIKIEAECKETDDSDNELYEALIDEEERKRGRISKKNYLAYIQACGWTIGYLYLLFSFVNQGAAIALDVWLGVWSTETVEADKNLAAGICTNSLNNIANEGKNSFQIHQQRMNKSSNCIESSQVQSYLQVFSLLSGFAVLVGFMTICLAQIASHRGRRVLHQKLFSAVVGSQIKFFDINPLGRILNRFSSDTSMIDKELGWSVMHLVFFALLCSSAVLVNAFISPVFVIATIPVGLIYYFIQHVFRCTSRELKRLESLSRSPILGLITETANSPTVIRAYKAEDKFFSSYFKRLDTYLSSSILLHAGNRWLGISLDYMGSIIVFLSMIACLIGSTVNLGNYLTPATVGLAIKYTLTIPVYLNWLVRFLSDTEMCLNSVERIRQYTSLRQESNIAEDDNPKKNSYERLCCPVKKCRCRRKWSKKSNSLKCCQEVALPDSFPVRAADDLQDGRIEFQRVNLYYDRRCEPAVSNLSFIIKPGQKIGVCGRTGSGKSSMLQGILGMVDYHEGSILINGIDTEAVPLDHLRKSLSIVLQEDCVFKGTIRFNMDPESKFQDDILWNSLELVYLKDFVSSLPKKLYTEIGSGNITLSTGQIQLLTLARVILAKKSIVLLDEVTASLDLQLERNLFAMLKRELPHSTILHVTHSVPCLLESDRVLVFQKGELIEDGTPQELLEDKRGCFTSLLQSMNKYS